MTYENVGHEALEELLAVCDPCHAWLSGKADVDPTISRFGGIFLGGNASTEYDWRQRLFRFDNAKQDAPARDGFTYQGPFVMESVEYHSMTWTWQLKHSESAFFYFPDQPDATAYIQYGIADALGKLFGVATAPGVTAPLCRAPVMKSDVSLGDAWAWFVDESILFDQLIHGGFRPDPAYKVWRTAEVG